MLGELVRRPLKLMAQDSPDGACGCGFQVESLIYLLVLEDVFTLLNVFFWLGHMESCRNFVLPDKL